MFVLPVPVRRGLAAAAFLVAAVAGSVGAASADGATATPAPYCGITWGSLPKVSEPLGAAPLLDVRAGQHDCYDRVVFDFDGPAGGYQVDYADQVYSEGRGEPLTVAGGARLHVGLHNPAGSPAIPTVAGYRTLRDVVYGGSFEGYSTFAIGVRARLPFRVFTLAGPGTHSRLVVDVAHRWS
jgi:hypothetical protein